MDYKRIVLGAMDFESINRLIRNIAADIYIKKLKKNRSMLKAIKELNAPKDKIRKNLHVQAQAEMDNEIESLEKTGQEVDRREIVNKYERLLRERITKAGADYLPESIVGTTELNPYDIIDGGMDIEHAILIYKKLGDIPAWLKGMKKAQEDETPGYLMTEEEYIQKELLRHGGEENLLGGDVSILYSNSSDDHYMFVERALSEGKPVPAKVLKDYPELQEKYKANMKEIVLTAYRKLKARTKFPDVEIYALQQEIGSDMGDLKAFLLEESRKGNAVLSIGDWSLSDENVRSGAIYIRGKAHLLVYFKFA